MTLIKRVAKSNVMLLSTIKCAKPTFSHSLTRAFSSWPDTMITH